MSNSEPNMRESKYDYIVYTKLYKLNDCKTCHYEFKNSFYNIDQFLMSNSVL